MEKLDLNVKTNIKGLDLINSKDIKNIFDNNLLTQIAITNNGDINIALRLQKEFGNKIIVGQTILVAGKQAIIGLFLGKYIPSGLHIQRTAELIRAQRGLVYIPSPFNTKYGIGSGGLDILQKRKLIDILETQNGWAYRRFGSLKENKQNIINAQDFANANNIVTSVSSASYFKDTIGNSFNIIDSLANKDNLLTLLKESEKKSEFNSAGYLYIKKNIEIFFSRFKIR